MKHVKEKYFYFQDTPANYYATSNTISVKYRSSVNNGGRGWVIHFASVKGSMYFIFKKFAYILNNFLIPLSPCNVIKICNFCFISAETIDPDQVWTY